MFFYALLLPLFLFFGSCFVHHLATMRNVKFQPKKAKNKRYISILNLSKKSQEKSQEKNHVKAYKQKKIKRAKTMKKTTKKAKESKQYINFYH